MEKPAHTHYYLRFEADEGDVELREFFAIGVRSGIGIGDEVVQTLEEFDNNPTVVQAQKAIFDALGPEGLTWLKEFDGEDGVSVSDVVKDGNRSNDNRIQFNIK